MSCLKCSKQNTWVFNPLDLEHYNVLQCCFRKESPMLPVHQSKKTNKKNIEPRTFPSRMGGNSMQVVLLMDQTLKRVLMVLVLLNSYCMITCTICLSNLVNHFRPATDTSNHSVQIGHWFIRGPVHFRIIYPLERQVRWANVFFSGN